jgi:pimeloyl-ACP methyl ester carboxylesterase
VLRILIEESYNIGRFRCRTIYNNTAGLPIVFLHGYSFTSDIWRDIGLLDYLEREKIPFLAIDMPYGARSVCSPHTRSVDENIFVVREVFRGIFGSVKPLIVGASLGGYVALKYAVRYHVAGLLLIAPVNVFDEELMSKYGSLSIPVLIIWGSRDRIVSRTSMEKLSEMLEAKLLVYESAGHPAYLDYPDRFRNDLLAFHRALKLE